MRNCRTPPNMENSDLSRANASSHIAWINGWRRTPGGVRLDAVLRNDNGFCAELLPPSMLLPSRTVLDTTLAFSAGMRREMIRIEVDDLSRLLSLVRPPGSFLRKSLPQSDHSRHIMFVAEGKGGTAYIPAALLVRELWLWSRHALDALLTPGALDLFLSAAELVDDGVIDACGPLAHGRGATLRRLSWLAQCADARASWNSVLSYLHAGTLNLRLPKASLTAWGLGVQLDRGVLVSILGAVRIGFTLPVEGATMRFGRRSARCPHQPAWTSHPQPNLWALVSS